MSLKKVVILVALCAVAVADFNIKIGDSILAPRHYEVDLTLDPARKTFTVDTVITLEILQETRNIEFFRKGTEGPYLNSVIVNESGEEFKAKSYQMVVGGHHIELMFDADLVPGVYKLHLLDAKGSFGDGLVEVPMPSDSGDSTSR